MVFFCVTPLPHHSVLFGEFDMNFKCSGLFLGIFILAAPAALAEPMCTDIDRKRSLDEAAAEAKRFLDPLMTAVSNLKSTFGDDVFAGVPEVDTPTGRKTLGVVFGEELKAAGYPSFDDAQRCNFVFRDFGFDDPAMFLLVATPADQDSIDHLMASLQNIVK
jgi:hypothetical protein